MSKLRFLDISKIPFLKNGYFGYVFSSFYCYLFISKLRLNKPFKIENPFLPKAFYFQPFLVHIQ